MRQGSTDFATVLQQQFSLVSHHSTNECSVVICHQGLAGTVGPFMALLISPCSQILAVHTVIMADLSTYTSVAQYEKHQHTIQQNLCNISLASCDIFSCCVTSCLLEVCWSLYTVRPVRCLPKDTLGTQSVARIAIVAAEYP